MTNLKTFHIIIYVALKANFGRAGIDVPKTECAWINGDYGKEIKCDGNQVVIGACGWVSTKYMLFVYFMMKIYYQCTFRAGRYADCPGDHWHQLLCCTMPDFYFGHCAKYGTGHGELNSCLSHGVDYYLLEGTCGSGAELDCDGYSVINDCCEGHLITGNYSI